MKTSLPESSKEYILQYLLKQEKATANQIAKSLNISSQATRRHLRDLENERLIEHDTIQIKIGRPQYLYYLSQKGRDRFPHRYGEFAVSFLDTLRETVGETQVSQVLQKQWERKAANYRQHLRGSTLEDKVAKLVEMRHKEGYMAELYSLDENQGKKKKFFFTEHHCAISEVAESYPQVCGHELEMFASLFPDCTVERTHWINNGEHRCGYLIKTK